MIWTIKLFLILGATITYAASINNERKDTSNSNVVRTTNNATVEVADGVRISESSAQLAKPVHNDLTSTPVALLPNVSKNATTQNANSTAIVNSTSSTSTTTTTSTTVVPPKVLINYNFPPLNKTSTAAPNKTQTATSTTERNIPVSEIEVGEKNDNKMSVPKKGFWMDEELKKTEDLLSSSSTTTTPKPRPKKPTVTIGNDDTVVSIGNNATRVTANANMNLPPTSTKTDYIVPIVGVILSVPLVAILLNLVYRKTKDWWQYRHYKRMDLIDGIYNN